MSGKAPEANAQGPDDTGGIRVSAPSRAAGGFGAIRSSLLRLARDTGLVRGVRALARMNQPGGFDCPGCAWPEPAHRSPLELCENGVKAIAWEAAPRAIGAPFFAAHSVAALGERSEHWLGEQGRIAVPLVLRPGATHYEATTYEDAFALIGAELRAAPSPDAVAFYTSGRTSNEAAFLYQLFARAFGTNNLPDCSNLCHESSGIALKETIGVGKGTVQLDDFERADAIFIIGQNPGTNHPRMLTTLQAAASRGCRIVSINPLPEPGLTRFAHPQNPAEVLLGGTAIATLHLPVRVNGDVALLKGIMKHMLAEEARRPGQVLDRAFLAAHTDGFEALAADLERAAWEDLEHASGIDRARMAEAAEIAWTSKATIACWAMGLTQHKNAVANIQQVVNLLLLRGNVGRPGAGFCPVRGHSNVQGDRTMGISCRVDDGFLDRLGARYEFSPPRGEGLDAVATIEAMRAGRVTALVALGGNFLSANPDTLRTAEALRGCALTVHVATKLNRAHLVHGRTAVVLPCLGRTERDDGPSGPRFVTVESSMGIVQQSRGHLPPVAPGLLSEPEIVAGLARATLGAAHGIPWRELGADYDRVRDDIAAVVTDFERFNDRVRAPGGILLPNTARERRFVTATGRARFTVHPVTPVDLRPGELLMMTIRSHDQYNTTIYGLDDRLRGVFGGRRVVFLHRDDIAARGLAPGDIVDLHSRFQGEARSVSRFKVVAYDVPRGCAATYFPEANPLVPLGAFADKSRTPASKSVVITVTPAAAAVTAT